MIDHIEEWQRKQPVQKHIDLHKFNLKVGGTNKPSYVQPSFISSHTPEKHIIDKMLKLINQKMKTGAYNKTFKNTLQSIEEEERGGKHS